MKTPSGSNKTKPISKQKSEDRRQKTAGRVQSSVLRYPPSVLCPVSTCRLVQPVRYADQQYCTEPPAKGHRFTKEVLDNQKVNFVLLEDDDGNRQEDAQSWYYSHR